MIELTPNTAIMVYLCLTLATLLIIWGYHHFLSRKHKVNIIEEKLFICEYCRFAYLDRIGKPVTHCPQCGSYNK